MSIEFEFLPIIVLEQIFDSINKDELIGLCFLNRYLYSVIYPLIYDFSCLCGYIASPTYFEFQTTFIMRNGKAIKHLKLNTIQDVYYLKSCSNITSLFINSNAFVNQLNLLLTPNKFKKLKILTIYNNDDELKNMMICFSNILSQISTLSIYSSTVDSDLITQHLNSHQLRKLIIEFDHKMHRDCYNVIVDKFNHLDYLKLSYYNSENSFYSKPTLFIKSPNMFKMNLGYSITYLSQIEHLNYQYIYIDFNESIDISLLDKVNKANIKTLGYINELMLDEIKFSSFINLSKISINRLGGLHLILNSILLITTIHTVEFVFIDLINCNRPLILFERFDLNNNILYSQNSKNTSNSGNNNNDNNVLHDNNSNNNHDLSHDYNNNGYYYNLNLYSLNIIKYNYIKKLIFKFCKLSIQDIFYCFYLFPNLELIQFDYFVFLNSSPNNLPFIFKPITFHFSHVHYYMKKDVLFNLLKQISLITIIIE